MEAEVAGPYFGSEVHLARGKCNKMQESEKKGGKKKSLTYTTLNTDNTLKADQALQVMSRLQRGEID